MAVSPGADAHAHESTVLSFHEPRGQLTLHYSNRFLVSNAALGVADQDLLDGYREKLSTFVIPHVMVWSGLH